MKLKDVLQNVQYELLFGDINIDITSMTIDSRTAKLNSMFICIPGFQVDGHNFANTAHDLGSTVFIVEKEIAIDATVIKVKNSREALAIIAYNFYNKPDIGLNMIGITGTNGKTSVSFYIQSILMQYGHNTGIIGTVSTKINDQDIDINFATSTTPDTIELMQIIRHMKEQKADSLVMEVTSHGLALNKVDALRFYVSVFTNLTQDHLDLHGTMENYRDAKAKLFTMSDISIINIDDEYGTYMQSISTGKVITYSIDKPSDIQAKNIKYEPTGSTFDVYAFSKIYKFNIPIPGRFSIYNALGSIGTCLELGVPIDTIQRTLSTLKTVPGRIDTVKNDKNLNIIIDYAHTPDSLKNVIQTAKEFTTGCVITVFGCGGDRDNQKRSVMAKEASTYGDFTIITSDNPRTEDPEIILNQVEQGIVGQNYERILDREQAINRAIEIMSNNDTVIIAGKGHETYQILKDKTIDFDDKAVALEAVNRLK